MSTLPARKSRFTPKQAIEHHRLERSLALMRKAMRLNPHHPGWYYVVPFLYHYYHGEYETALFDAKRFNTHDYFWDPLTRTAVLGQLNRQAEAKKSRK
jgi:hypothetical protein